MPTYFTSDWHLRHSNIIKYAKRPFNNVLEMNKAILDMFFATVKKGDTVYFLGDFAFSSKSQFSKIVELLEQITETTIFHCILGNHDYKIQNVLEQHCKSISPLRTINLEGEKITLCHYPMHTFSASHHNTWQLYGHHHSDTNKEILGKRYNVCLEANDYKLVSFEQLKEIMLNRENNWDYLTPEFLEKQKRERQLAKGNK